MDGNSAKGAMPVPGAGAMPPLAPAAVPRLVADPGRGPEFPARKRDLLRGVAKIFPPEDGEEAPPGRPAGAVRSRNKSGTQQQQQQQQPQQPVVGLGRGRDMFWDNKVVNVAFFGASGSGHCHFCYRSTQSPRPVDGASSAPTASLQIERCHVLFNYCDQQCRSMAEYCVPLDCE